MGFSPFVVNVGLSRAVVAPKQIAPTWKSPDNQSSRNENFKPRGSLDRIHGGRPSHTESHPKMGRRTFGGQPKFHEQELLQQADSPQHRKRAIARCSIEANVRMSVFPFPSRKARDFGIPAREDDKRSLTRRNPREHRATKRGNTSGPQRTRKRTKTLKSNHPWMANVQRVETERER